MSTVVYLLHDPPPGPPQSDSGSLFLCRPIATSRARPLNNLPDASADASSVIDVTDTFIGAAAIATAPARVQIPIAI